MADHEAIDSAINVISGPKYREILAAVNDGPLSVKELAEELDISRTTVYRHLERLEEHDLVNKRTFIAPDGNHYTKYECNFQSAIITLQGTEYDVMIYRSDSIADKFADMWETIRQIGGE